MSYKVSYDVGTVDRDGGSILVNPGRYLCEIIKHKFYAGQDGKADRVMVVAKVIDASDADNKKFENANVVDSITFHENAAWKVANFLDSLYGRKFEGNEIDFDDWHGKRLTISMIVDEYNGKESNRFERFMPASMFTAADGAEPASDDEEVDI